MIGDIYLFIFVAARSPEGDRNEHSLIADSAFVFEGPFGHPGC